MEWRPRVHTRPRDRPPMNSKDDIKEHVGQDRMSATEDCQRLKSMEEAYAQSWIEKG